MFGFVLVGINEKRLQLVEFFVAPLTTSSGWAMLFYVNKFVCVVGEKNCGISLYQTNHLGEEKNFFISFCRDSNSDLAHSSPNLFTPTAPRCKSYIGPWIFQMLVGVWVNYTAVSTWGQLCSGMTNQVFPWSSEFVLRVLRRSFGVVTAGISSPPRLREPFTCIDWFILRQYPSFHGEDSTKCTIDKMHSAGRGEWNANVST